MKYSQELMKEASERDMFKIGFLTELARRGVAPTEFESMLKCANIFKDILSHSAKTLHLAPPLIGFGAGALLPVLSRGSSSGMAKVLRDRGLVEDYKREIDKLKKKKKRRSMVPETVEQEDEEV
jgi:hypothetical protein